MKKILWTGVKYAGIATGAVLFLLFTLPIVFPGTAAEQIKKWTNRNIDGELNFAHTSLSFFEHFPHLTLTLHDFSLTGAEPFAGDTLLAGKALSFGLDLASVFGETLEVSTFYIDDARINVQVDTQGRANYNIYTGGSKPDTEPDSSNTRLKIAGIFINRCHLVYHDRSLPMRIEAEDFYYEGRGDLANSQFDLKSNMRAATFDFEYAGTAYFQDRKLKADLVTGINTASLVFRFAKNQLLINQLPVDFSGDMAILKDGYDIDLNVVSGTTDFGNIFSALPPEYDAWFAGTKFSGQSQIRVDMKGHYRAATGEAPDLAVRLWVHDGVIRYQKAPAPLEHLWVNGTVRLPALDPQRLSLTIDTLNFDLNGAPTRATLFVEGLDQPYIRTDLRSQIDLALLDSALGLSGIDLQGRLRVQLHADGHYRTRTGPKGDTAITSIPAYHLEADLQNGHLRLPGYELPIRDIQARLQSDGAKGRWQDITLALDSFQAALGEGRLAGRLVLNGLDKSSVSADLKATLRLEDLARALPVQGYAFGGGLSAEVKAEGPLDAAKKRFPAVTGTLTLKDGRLQTPYYPQAIEHIQLDARLDGQSGGYNDLRLRLQPLSFVFEQQPFTLRAELQNPDAPRYRLAAQGALDLGRLYQVFAVKGYDMTGLLYADLELEGSAADAETGRYDRLRNKGILRLSAFELRSADYPDPFFLPAAALRFEQDKAWLTDTRLRYRKNEFTLNGYARNIVGYAMGSGPLEGRLDVRSPRVVVDDFMALAPPARPASPVPAAPKAPGGVVLLPKDMFLTLDAGAGEVVYGQTRIQHFAGQVSLDSGNLLLRETHLQIAGATIGLEGRYAPVHQRRAHFNFVFKADSFDVKRAYNEVPLFREMASAAEKASGLVSVNYQLQGRLNDRMEPVYPSIQGKGYVKLEQVNVQGLKLFGAVSKATGKADIDNPDLKAVVIKSSIANNLITIERTKMKVLGFRPRIEGQTSLDGRLNLRFRLGLPPFGLLGIPMTITGTSDNPVVEVRKGKDGDALEEEVDTEEESEQ